jgi:O-methyltransferase involved in polyketide biosynthesis
MAIEGRQFLKRVIRYMAFQGIDQFIDIGSGLPSADNTHQVAQRVHPNAHVVYVDIDETAVAYGQQILAGNPLTTFIHGSVLELDPILNHPETKKLIDFSKPVGVVMMGLVHFFSIDTGRDILKTLQKNLASGSLLSITHGVTDHLTDEVVQKVLDAYARTPTPLTMRPVAEVQKIIDGFQVVEPGLTLLHNWKMDIAEEGETEPPKSYVWAGVVLST